MIQQKPDWKPQQELKLFFQILHRQMELSANECWDVKPKLHFYRLSTKLLVQAQNFHEKIDTEILQYFFLSKPS